MVFSSVTFIFYFLPLTVLIYYMVPNNAKNAALLFFSLVFYGFGEPVYIVIMIVSIFVDYWNGLFIEKYRQHRILPRIFLSLSIIANLGLLGFFKYGDFLDRNVNGFFSLNIPLMNIALPIGISFFTFQTMSYSIDVYRGKTRAQKNIITFGTYVSMFPQLIAGPIVIYKDVEKQLKERLVTWQGLYEGVLRFTLGLGKKVLLANSIGLLWEEIRMIPHEELSVAVSWMGILAFALQIYFDFSGYSDMAIGLGKIFGFDFPENFNYPFISRSITEFWRRWHMSLSRWFRDYLYIPMGGNQRGTLTTLRNIFLVWLLTGFWHGAGWNYLLWGGYFGVMLILEKYVLRSVLSRLGEVSSRLYTLTVLLFSFAIFAIEDLIELSSYLQIMLGQGVFVDERFLYYLTNFGILFILLVFSATPLPYSIYRRLNKKEGAQARILSGSVLFAVFIVSIAYIVDGAYNPFLYFRF
ncbi:MAG TPA: MBOAT family O-acyltransferase [Bacteroidales bacterium]|nr:MBOAT family O-acyltransferase [Bacteroidales bacterium]